MQLSADRFLLWPTRGGGGVIGFQTVNIWKYANIRAVPWPCLARSKKSDIRQTFKCQVNTQRTMSHPNLPDVPGKFRIQLITVQKL